MASNNYALALDEKPVIADNDLFFAMLDDGKQEYAISCERTSNMPTLFDIETAGMLVGSDAVLEALRKADEARVLSFGNGVTGVFMRHGTTHTYLAKTWPKHIEHEDVQLAWIADIAP